MVTDTAAQVRDRADEAAERFTVPVVLAALASVPAPVAGGGWRSRRSQRWGPVSTAVAVVVTVLAAVFVAVAPSGPPPV